MVDFHDLDVSKIGAEEINVSDLLLKFDLGDTNIRILPPWRAGAQYYKPYKMHFSLNELRSFGLETDGWFAEPCLSERETFDGESWQTTKGRCPLCALANEAWRIGTKENDQDMIGLSKRIRAKRQYASNVVDLKELDKGVRVMVYGKKIFDGTKAIFVRRGNITHPVKGYNIFVTKSEIPGQKWCDYTVTQDEQVDFTEEWSGLKDHMQNLDDFPNYSTYEEIQNNLKSVSFGGVSKAADSKSDRVPEGYSSPKTTDVDSLLDDVLSMDD